MAAKAEIGTLIVVILKARNLNDKHFYKQDVYAEASLSGVKQKTQTDLKGGQHPVWDAELRYQIQKDTSQKNRQLEISCFSPERRKDDELLGKGTVDITETLKTGEFDDWVPLSIDGVQRGDVYLEMTFYSNAAPPPQPAPAPKLIVPTQTRPLQVPSTGGLVRRPSKLPEHERLARLTTASPPPTNIRPGAGASHGRYPSSNGYNDGIGQRLGIPSPNSSRSSSSASDRAESPLPPLPGDYPSNPLPGTLLPAGGRGGRHGGSAAPHIQPAASPPKAPPSTLRPGGPPPPVQANNPYVRRPDPSPSRSDYRPPPLHQNSSENNPYVRPSTASPAPPGGPYYDQVASPQTAVPAHYGGGYERVASPQTAVPPTHYPPPAATPTPGPQYGPPQYGAPQYAPQQGYHPASSPPPPQAQPSWSGGGLTTPLEPPSGPVFFPVPSITPAPPGPSYGPPPPVHTAPPHAFSPYPPPRQDDGLPDPYLQKRYQTPLPLPPGASSSPPRGRQLRPEPEVPKKEPAPPPKEVPPVRQEPRISEAEQIRLETQRIEEEEEARRLEQEKRDMELALQLDRELNV